MTPPEPSAATPLPVPSPGRPAPQASHKISKHHLQRLSAVYIRQSSLQQVFQHTESRDRQYELRDRAVTLGWPRDRILVIDDDQGLSGQTASLRGGFQRLLSEVSLGHIGLVLGLEMSRLARCSSDFQYLVELCALSETLIADADTLYDPRDPNDRLLLGLKGTMSEFELVTMRQRLLEGRLHKARRCGVFHGAPTGYIKVCKGRLEFDPDEQVRRVVELIFSKFQELGSLGALFRYLLEHGIRIGIRQRSGPRCGQIAWQPPNRSTLRQILHNPIYAGAYVYGRTATVGPAERRTARSLRMEEWQVLEQGRLPAYISWEQYLANQARLSSNRAIPDQPGVARRGAALLSGLVVCAVCGHRMTVNYPASGRPYYRCRSGSKRGQADRCGPAISAVVVDRLVQEQLLAALQPAALELHLHAVAEIEAQRRRLDQHWQGQLQQARHEAVEAAQCYRSVDPKNRRVAQSLEDEWEAALAAVERLTEEYNRWRLRQPPELTPPQVELIEGLAQEIPQLWESAGATIEERKEVVRCLVERVEVRGEARSERVEVRIGWHGGAVSEHRVARPMANVAQMSDEKKLRERLRELRRDRKTMKEIAEILNREGFRPPQQRGPYTYDGVRQLLVRLGLTGGRKQPLELGEYEWRLADLAEAVGLAEVTLRSWLREDRLRGRQVGARRAWVAWADEDELERLRQLARERKQQARRQ
jgi:DNA invertase Pin-like site-specific DNA recombinase